MADEPDNDTPETAEDAPEQTPAVDATDAAPGEIDTTAEADASEPDADAAVHDATPVVESLPAEPVEQLSPKERRRKTRSKHSGDVRPSRSPEERHAARLLERRDKATRRRARRLQERAKAAERRAAAPAPEDLPPVHAPVEGTRRVRQGIVVSDKAQKTITVRIDVARRHRRYEKIVRSSSTVHAHDENNEAHEGDVVRVIESRPLSRTKRWALVDVLERAR